MQSSNREKLGFPKPPSTDQMALEDERQRGGVEGTQRDRHRERIRERALGRPQCQTRGGSHWDTPAPGHKGQRGQSVLLSSDW